MAFEGIQIQSGARLDMYQRGHVWTPEKRETMIAGQIFNMITQTLENCFHSKKYMQLVMMTHIDLGIKIRAMACNVPA